MLMNVDINYNDELKKNNTDPRLLPDPNKEKFFIPESWPKSKTSNRSRSVLVLEPFKHISKSKPSHIIVRSSSTS